MRTLTLLGVGASAAYAMAGLSMTRPAVAAERPHGGALRLGMRVLDVSSPHTFSWIWDSNVVRQVAEYLTITGHDNITRPYLLESWQPSDDLRTWTLHLRKGIRWHNGREFVADDVIWNLQRVLDESVGSSVQGLMKGYMLSTDETAGKQNTRIWDANAIERIDAHTVRLNCKAPQLAVPEHLFHYPLLMLDPEEDGYFTVGSNGTGAFELVEHEVGASSLLKARKHYWGTGPFVDSLEFVDLGDDPTGEIEAMASRSMHGIDIVDILQLEAFKLIDHLRRYEVPTASTGVARGKVTVAPFNDVRVRQAMRLAIDPYVIQKLVYAVGSSPAEHHHVAPVHPEYAALPPLVRDVPRARDLLAQAGYPNGIDLGNIDCISSPNWQFNALQAMTEQWREAGIEVQINLMPSTEFWSVWNKTTFGFTGWTHRPLGVMALGLGYRTGVPWNESDYANPEFDRLLTQAEGLIDIEERRKVMAKIQLLLQQDGPIVQPLWRSEVTFMDKRVQGFQMHPSTYIFANELAIADA